MPLPFPLEMDSDRFEQTLSHFQQSQDLVRFRENTS